jgi:prepilin-type N-terminal cleavage/methylation domain-containing protein
MTINTKKRKAFTLIELLVVIAIIAMLLSILMPALGKVKEKAKDVVCRSSLKQWSLIFSLFNIDYNDSYPIGDEGGSVVSGFNSAHWLIMAGPYYEIDKIRLCPNATKPSDRGGQGANAAYKWLNDDGQEELLSYGFNNWLYNPKGATLWNYPTKPNWRRHSNIKMPSNVPLVFDNMRPGAHPTEVDSPSSDDDGAVTDYVDMTRVCINRHNMAVNVVFADGAAKKVYLKELWNLKWSKDFVMGKGFNRDIWPDWMK